MANHIDGQPMSAGDRARRQGTVNRRDCNERNSSRSPVFTLHIRERIEASDARLLGSLNLVDSRQWCRLTRPPKQRDSQKETCAINKSLPAWATSSSASPRLGHVPKQY
jgi:hypothetical protein